MNYFSALKNGTEWSERSSHVEAQHMCVLA